MSSVFQRQAKSVELKIGEFVMGDMDFRDDEEIIITFIEETKEHLLELESGILWLEKNQNAPNEERIHSMFRAAHSIKAGANLLDLRNIEKLAHLLENALQSVRQGQMIISMDLANIFLSVNDKIAEMVKSPFESDNIDIASLLEYLEKQFRQ